MRFSLLILAAAACAKPFGGQLRFRALENETAPAVSDTPDVQSVPDTTPPAANSTTSVPAPVADNGAQGAAALDALIKRRLPAR